MNEVNVTRSGLVASNFVGGEWVKGSAGSLEVLSPYTGKACGELFLSNKKDVDDAIEIANTKQKEWVAHPLKTRTQIMFNFRDILIRDQEKISQIVSLESGKTLPEARAGLMKGLEVLEYALSLQNSDLGGRMEVSRGVWCEYRREALGVVTSISPFNFPAMVPLWTVPIAITLGNAYVWKPSEKTPLTGNFLAGAFQEAGLPAGIFTIIQGGQEAVESIIDNDLIKAVGFVGSSKIAKAVYQRSTLKGKRALCLGGAKNHIILLPDADIDVSGAGISDSFTGCAGQRCMAASVLLAVGDVDNHLENIKKRAQSQTLGDSMGAVITKEQVEFLGGAIEQAVKDGATLILDGRNPTAPKGCEDGFWLGPTILDDVAAGSMAATTELFGPILSIVRCKNVSEAIEVQNSSSYGNSASVFTSSGPLAEQVAAGTNSGMFGINIGVPVPREPFSFGGINDSKFGHGDITGKQSLDFWSNTRKITTKWENQSDSNWMG